MLQVDSLISNKVRGMKQLVLRLFSQVRSKMQLISRILVSLLVRARTLSLYPVGTADSCAKRLRLKLTTHLQF